MPSVNDIWDKKLGRQAIQVRKIYTLPKYQFRNEYNLSWAIEEDIALLKLKKPIRDWELKTVCLPTEKKWNKKWNKKTADVYGWGRNEVKKVNEFKDYLSNHGSYCLQEGKVRTMSHEKCKKKLMKLDKKCKDDPGHKDYCKFYYKDMKPWVFCALGRKKKGNGYTDTCAGDSGGPISISQKVDGQNEKQHLQIGVTHAGPGNCGLFKNPGRYAQLHPGVVRWIFKTMNKYGGAKVCQEPPPPED